MPPPTPFGDIVATLGPPERSDEVQTVVESAVTSRYNPSLNLAVAVNCWEPETGIVLVEGVTTRETIVTFGTVQVPPPPPPHPDRILANTLITTIHTRYAFRASNLFIKPPFKNLSKPILFLPTSQLSPSSFVTFLIYWQQIFSYSTYPEIVNSHTSKT
jgi:hypothetical protein